MQRNVNGTMTLGSFVVANMHVPFTILFVQVVGTLLSDLQICKIAA